MPNEVLIRRAGRFGLVGTLATCLHVVIAVALVSGAGQSSPLANGVAFVVATIFSYVANTHWSFAARVGGRTLLRYLVAVSLGCMIAMGISAGAGILGLHFLIGIGLVAATMPAFNFMLHNFWTYK